jgi:tetratricopeptide (TPR) repeat protein
LTPVLKKKTKKVRKKDIEWEAELFDTSKPTAKFRKARIGAHRKRDFDEDRDLSFVWDRDIDARLTGVVFRKKGAIGFRNMGVENLDDVMEPSDWPDTGKAEPPETMSKKRFKGYQKRWGKDKTYAEQWGVHIPLIKQPNAFVTHHVVEKGHRADVEKISTGDVNRRRAFTYNEYGLALMEEGDYKEALSYFTEAIKMDPGEDTYRINLQRCKEWYDYSRRRRKG